MQFGTFTQSNGDNSHARYKVIAYHSDALLQDKRINVASGITSDLIVGDLVDTSGAIASDIADIAYLIVESAKSGDKTLVVAEPHHVIISRAGIEFNGLDETMTLMALADKGFTYSDYATVALRTT